MLAVSPSSNLLLAALSRADLGLLQPHLKHGPLKLRQDLECPDRRIDYVFVHGRDERFRGEPIEARVCFDAAVGVGVGAGAGAGGGAGAGPEGTYPSDHFGVIATLRTG